MKLVIFATVSLLLNGLGATPAPTVTVTGPLTLAAVSVLPGEIGGVWLVTPLPAGPAV